MEKNVRDGIRHLSVTTRLLIAEIGATDGMKQIERMKTQLDKEQKHLSIINLILRRALCHERMGNIDQALHDFQWVLENKSTSHEAARGVASIYRHLNYPPLRILSGLDAYVKTVLNQRRIEIEKQRKIFPPHTPISFIISNLPSDLDVNVLVLVERLRLQLQESRIDGLLSSIWLLFSSRFIIYDSRTRYSSRFNPSFPLSSDNDVFFSSLCGFHVSSSSSSSSSHLSLNPHPHPHPRPRFHPREYIQNIIGEEDLFDLIVKVCSSSFLLLFVCLLASSRSRPKTQRCNHQHHRQQTVLQRTERSTTPQRFSALQPTGSSSRTSTCSQRCVK